MAIKPGAVVDKGGNKLFILQMDVSGATYAQATLTVETYLFDLGYIANSDVAQNATKTDFDAEEVDTVTSSFTYTRMTSGNLMQSDAALIDLLADTVKGKVYLEGKYTGNVNNTYQWHFKLVRITPQFSVKRPGGTNSLAYESTGIKLNSAITISAATMASINNLLTLSNFPTTTLTISTSKNYAIMEV